MDDVHSGDWDLTMFSLIGVLGVLQTLAFGPRIDRVGWLQGCWVLNQGDRTIEEQWLSPRASSMLGVGRTTRGTTLVEYQMVLIRERGDVLAYEAHPSEGLPSVFLSQSVGDRAIVFKNLKDDFPQRIGYQQSTPDRLLTWTEGLQEGKLHRQEYAYERVPCPGD